MGIKVHSFRQSPEKRLKLYKKGLPQKLIANSNIEVAPRRKYPRQAFQSPKLKIVSIQKRILDVVFSSVAIIILLPLLPVFAVLIKRSSSGPIFFKQQREGKNGELFWCYKFRSMHVSKKTELNNVLPPVTKKRDARIFKFGQFMRQNNLDELPQLLNVIKGDMSLAGPRPYMVSECAYWKTVFEDFRYREQIKPGLSGLAQVNGYRGGSLCKKHMRTRLHYDLIYLQSYSLWVDIKIIARTTLQMLQLKTEAH